MIYLDNAATTAPDSEAVSAAIKYLQEQFYNPSALYGAGFAVHQAMEEARKNLLAKIAPDGFEWIFTASGSEADNQALFSSARRGNLVTTEGEHAAVYRAAKELENRGIEVRFAKLRADGSVDSDDLISKLDAKTSLVSVIHVNNETGAINDIAQISSKVKAYRPNIAFHSDGVQAFGKIPVVLPRTIDLYSVSAHKIGGIRGVGGLIKRKSFSLHPLIFGGGQENGLRSGTENTFAIKQFEFAAAHKFASLEQDLKRVRVWNERVRQGLNPEIFEILSSEGASPYILSVTARGLRGEVLLHMLDDAGIQVGTGSACSSKNRYSRVMLACGLDECRADGVLRLSFSARQKDQEIEEALQAMNACAASLKERTR